MGDENISVDIKIPFQDRKLAEITYDVLRVDAEPKRSSVTKKLSVSENILKATFTGQEAKNLRVSVNTFFDNILLISKTMNLNGPPVADNYSYYEG